MPIPKKHKTKEAAAYLGISRDVLEGLAKKGVIARFKLGGNWFYCEKDLDDYYKRQRQGGLSAAAQLRSDESKAPRLRPQDRKHMTIEEARQFYLGAAYKPPRGGQAL